MVTPVEDKSFRQGFLFSTHLTNTPAELSGGLYEEGYRCWGTSRAGVAGC